MRHLKGKKPQAARRMLSEMPGPDKTAKRLREEVRQLHTGKVPPGPQLKRRTHAKVNRA